MERRIRDGGAAAIIVNTHSRRGERALATAQSYLQAGGMSIAESFAVKNPARLPEIARAVAARGAALVVVGGGDGTISSTVDALAYQDTALGVLPLGTGNSSGAESSIRSE